MHRYTNKHLLFLVLNLATSTVNPGSSLPLLQRIIKRCTLNSIKNHKILKFI